MKTATLVTLAILNGKVWTGNPRQPWATALAATNETITAVGTDAEIRKLCGKQTRIIDARGELVLPGFIDSHVHFLEGGFRLTSVGLRDAKSKQEFTERIRQFAAMVPAGTWITGGDWDHENWGGELPTRAWIDAVTARHPVWVNRLDGHMALANSLALRSAGVTRETADPAGGTIVRDGSGEPTGVLKDNAMRLVDRAQPPPSREQEDRALDAAMRYVAGQGVTSVHHVGTWEDLAVFQRMRAGGPMRTRIYAAVPLASWERLRDYVKARGRGDDWLRWGALKGFADGSLGSHTAAFFEPFTDAPGDRGLLVTPPEDLYRWTAGATRERLQVFIHAIGDRANALVLDAYERVKREQNPADPRFRIEHAQHLRAGDIGRFAKAGVIASMQPYHAIDDGRWAERVIGAARARTSYAFASLLAAGAKLAFGSDWFVAPPVPLEGLYAAVTRVTLDGRGSWVPEEQISFEQALRAYGLDAAYAAFDERKKGTLEPGKLADFILLDKDLFRATPAAWREAKVMLTVVGGRTVFQRTPR